MKKKLISVLMALVLVISLVPAMTAYALEGGGAVTITIENQTTFDQSVGAAWSGVLPGVDSLSVPISSGDTVLDVLEKALKQEVNGTALYSSPDLNTGYVTEINGLKAGDATSAGKNMEGCAGWDGWCFAVNHIMPWIRMGSVYVQNGDIIQVEYSLDGTVAGASYGSGNDQTTGFGFSAGVFSYVTGSYGSKAYTLTLPADRIVQVTAVPGAEGKAVRIYDDGILTGGLNSDISMANGSNLQIVVGNYDDVYQVAIRTADSVDHAALRAGIAASLGDNATSYWNIVGMLDNNSSFIYSDAAKQAYLNTAIDSFAHPTAYSATTMAMHIIAMTALGYDVTKMIDNGQVYNAFDILKTQVAADTGYGGWAEVYAYSLMAYLQADSTVRAQYAGEISAAITALSACPTGNWGYGTSPDSAGITLAALCMAESKGYSVDAQAKADAVSYLKSAVEQDGTVEESYSCVSNANSTAMTILGLDAAGEDVSGIKAGDDGKSLFSGLLLYALGDHSGFTYSNGGTVDDKATQQSFLALAAADTSGATNVFDFSGKGTEIPETSTAYTACPVVFSLVPNGAAVSVTKEGETTPEASVLAGRYDLSEGTYSYTVSQSGYVTKTGSITVTADDASNHVRKNMDVSLASQSSGSNTITVWLSVKVPIDNAGTYTYKNNWSSYTTTVSETLTMTAGCTVFDALDKALDKTGIAYDETAYGYIGTIDGLSQLDQGQKSGWLYQVNGTTPELGCRSYTLTGNSTVIWFYTDDYSSEYGSEKWSSGATSTASSNVSLSAALNRSTGAASSTLSGSTLTSFNQAVAAGGAAVLSVKVPNGANALDLTIPQSTVSALRKADNLSLNLQTDLANLTFDASSVEKISGAAGAEDLVVSITKTNASQLNENARQLIGDSPVYRFTLTAGDTTISDFGGGKVEVSIPYTLETGMDKNAVVVYYIDNTGELQSIRGVYHAQTGMVDFAVPHFSDYAVAYHKVIFTDVADSAWYHDAVVFCGARNITDGIGNSAFGPDITLTRGQFIVLLMRAYGLEPDQTSNDNFTDAGSTYYTGYLAAAKRLGISTGVGENKFAPDDQISRQDMATMLYRALDSLEELPTKAGNVTLADYSDSSQIADYAKTAMETFVESGAITGNQRQLNPDSTSTRAQMVQILYKLLSA